MDYSVKTGNPEKQKTGCLVLGVYESGELTSTAQHIDTVSNGFIHAVIKLGDITGRTGQTLLLHHVPNISAERLLLVGCGKAEETSIRDYRKILSSAYTALKSKKIRDAISYLTEINVNNRDIAWKTRQEVEISESLVYCFDQFKTGEKDPVQLKRVGMGLYPATKGSGAYRAIKEGKAISDGMTLCRDLGNLPGNICNPAYLARQARALARSYRKLTTQILDETEIKAMKMGAFMAVSNGSDEAGKLITLQYKGGVRGQAPFVLVGKGITFDTGGISLKPSAAMDEMKYDMCGAASVFGTIKAICELELPINVVGVIAAAENMPSGCASRPGDIVKTLSGKTVEILNTDAEGRLVLCDALTYAERFKPQVVIDVATLTGACLVALGNHVSGLLSNDEELANTLKAVGDDTYDRVWQLPLYDEYQEQLKSPFADMGNIGGRNGGTITAACFLSRFAEKFKWAHLDIAGTAWKSGPQNKGASGRPVPLLTQYLINQTVA